MSPYILCTKSTEISSLTTGFLWVGLSRLCSSFSPETPCSNVCEVVLSRPTPKLLSILQSDVRKRKTRHFRGDTQVARAVQSSNERLWSARCRLSADTCHPLGHQLDVRDHPPRSTQPGHPFMGRCNEYQPKGGDALRLESKGMYCSCVGGR